LKTFLIAHQYFAGVVYIAAFFIFHAGIVIQIHAPFDDLAATSAFHSEGVIAFFRFGGRGEKFLEEVHYCFSVSIMAMQASQYGIRIDQ
jgi:hypothetical protein